MRRRVRLREEGREGYFVVVGMRESVDQLA